MKFWGVLFAFVCLLLLLADPAVALTGPLKLESASLNCADYNVVTKQFNGGMQSIFSSGTGDPEQRLGMCTGGFFSRLMCLFQTTLGMVIATFFCGVQATWIGPFSAMLMIFMAAMGAMFITGVVDFTAKEVAIMMLKIGAITTFAFNTDIALNVAFKFFLYMTENTVDMFNGLFISSSTSLPVEPGFSMADKQILAQVQGTSTSNQCSFSGVSGAGAWILMVVGLLLFLPMIAGILIMAIIAGLAFFGRAAMGYLYSLTMITFLIAVMPIFVGLALFEKTRSIFDNWLSYLFSNSIQIMIVFGFLAYAAAVDVVTFLTDVGRLVTNYEISYLLPPMSFFNGTICSICKPNIIPHPNPLYTGMMIIAPSPNQCVSPEGISWWDILYETEFLFYLITNGVAIWAVASVLDELMKDVPDWAHSLGGSGASMIIGGVSRNYSPQNPGKSLVMPGFTNASLAFEKGFENAWKSGKSFDKEGQSIWRYAANRLAITRFAAAVASATEDVKYGNSQLSRADAKVLAAQKKRGQAVRKQKVVQKKSDVKRHELSIKELNKAKQELKEKQAAAQKVIEEMKDAELAEKLKAVSQNPELQAAESSLISQQKGLLEQEKNIVSLSENIIAKESALEKLEAIAPKTKEQEAKVAQDIANTKKELEQLKQQRLDAEAQRDLLQDEIQKQSDAYMQRLRAEVPDVGTQDTVLAGLDYRINELKARETGLALQEVEAKINSHITSLGVAEGAVKESESEAALWDKKTSDARFRRGAMELDVENTGKVHETYGEYSGAMEGIWGTAEASKYITDEEYIRHYGSKKSEDFAWASLMHTGDR